MKLWKHIIISTTAFLGISTTMLYTSCKDDACLKLKCRNGGTCADNLCKCPAGYEGTQCEKIAADRYTGFYYGTYQVGNEPSFLDTAIIDLVKKPATIMFRTRSRYEDTIIGTIQPSNIIIIKNDPKYGGRNITITLDDNTGRLNMQSNETIDGVDRAFTFIGTKQP